MEASPQLEDKQHFHHFVVGLVVEEALVQVVQIHENGSDWDQHHQWENLHPVLGHLAS